MSSAGKRSGFLPRGAALLPVFRTLSPEPFDAAALADRFKVRPSAVWQHGDLDAFDEVSTESGFSVSFRKTRSATVAFDRSMSFLSAQGQLLAALRSLGATSTIDFCLLVEAGIISSPVGLRFPDELLKLLLDTGTRLMVSHCITSFKPRS